MFDLTALVAGTVRRDRIAAGTIVQDQRITLDLALGTVGVGRM